MSLRNTATSYGSVAKSFHWIIFILLLIMIPFGYLLGDIPVSYKGAIYNIHKLIGITILAIMLLRALWVFMNPKPAYLSMRYQWQRWSERSVHVLLYVVVIAMPLVGWIGSSASGKPPHLGMLSFKLPVEHSKSIARSAFDLHSALAIVIMVLVGIHVLAALYHHFIVKDDVLRRMMPHGRRYH